MKLRSVTGVFLALITVIAASGAGILWTGIIKLEPYDPAAVARQLKPALEEKSLKVGAPIFIRIFKQSAELELWMKDKTANWQHFRTYPICYYSGSLGPKLKEGDKQSPEGFYSVSRGQMNPNSKYHLSFNLGYPNRYDRSRGRTGSFLMVHGNCVSIGCYAMTDGKIEEIYTLASKAHRNGQRRFHVHIFPFRMTDENMQAHAKNKWYKFWQTLKPAYDYFEEKRQVPRVAVRNKAYVVSSE